MLNCKKSGTHNYFIFKKTFTKKYLFCQSGIFFIQHIYPVCQHIGKCTITVSQCTIVSRNAILKGKTFRSSGDKSFCHYQYTTQHKSETVDHQDQNHCCKDYYCDATCYTGGSSHLSVCLSVTCLALTQVSVAESSHMVPHDKCHRPFRLVGYR